MRLTLQTLSTLMQNEIFFSFLIFSEADARIRITSINRIEVLFSTHFSLPFSRLSFLFLCLVHSFRIKWINCCAADICQRSRISREIIEHTTITKSFCTAISRELKIIWNVNEIRRWKLCVARHIAEKWCNGFFVYGIKFVCACVHEIGYVNVYTIKIEMRVRICLVACAWNFAYGSSSQKF